MKTIQCCIFDFDGVVMDTVPYHFQAWKAAFESQGVTFSWDDYVQKVNGLPRMVGITNILTDASEDKINEVAAHKQSLLLEIVQSNTLKPMDGVLEFMDYLKRSAIIPVVASSSKNAHTFLKQAGIYNKFSAVVSGTGFINPKPNPDIFLHAASLAHANPKTSLVIEDAAIGAEAGKRAGMYVVGLSHSKDKHISEFSDLVIHSMHEYQKIIDHFNEV